jgi:predicted HTH transcriptional regulator
MLGSRPDGARAATAAGYWILRRYGLILPAAEEVIAFLRKHMTREAIIGAVKRTDLWTFPVIAVREAIMNAIVHADYAQPGAPIRVALFDDRLEIENPACSPSASLLKTSKKEFPNSATASSVEYFRNWG